jgi:hypothetical protein
VACKRRRGRNARHCAARFRNRKRLRATLNRAWTSNDRQLVAADRRIADAHDRLLGRKSRVDQFVGLADANGFGDARQVFEV